MTYLLTDVAEEILAKDHVLTRHSSAMLDSGGEVML